MSSLAVPGGLSFLATLGVLWQSAGAGDHFAQIVNPSMTDVASTNATSNFAAGVASGAMDTGCQMEVMTDTSGRIAHRSNLADGTLHLNMISYKDFRINN